MDIPDILSPPRVYIFYEAYSLFSMQRTDESWLRAKCKDAEFYSNMRQHTDLCAQVEHRAMQWVFLHALNRMFTTSHVCGEKPCLGYLNDLIVRGIAWPAAIILCLFIVTIPSIITSMASRSIWHATDRKARMVGVDLGNSQKIIQNAPFYALQAKPQQPWTMVESEEVDGMVDEMMVEIDTNNNFPRRRRGGVWVDLQKTGINNLSHLIGEFEP